jgi:hypothetical protein
VSFVIEAYLNFRHAYDELRLEYRLITGKEFPGEKVPHLILSADDIRNNTLTMQTHIQQMAQAVMDLRDSDDPELMAAIDRRYAEYEQEVARRMNAA